MKDRLGFSDEKTTKITKYFLPKVSKIYDKYLFKIRFNSTLNAPMTSIISFWAELGILGIAFLIFLFAYLFVRLKRTAIINVESPGQILCRNDFLELMLFLLILNLFYYNYWEYPEIITPIKTFCILSITGRNKLQNS